MLHPEAGLSMTVKKINFPKYFVLITRTNQTVMEKGGCVYIMTNQWNTTLYTGVTSNLPARVIEHKEKAYPNSFTSRYNLDKLVYFKTFDSIEEAIMEEKLIKGKKRRWKEDLICQTNPGWDDLWSEIQYW